MSEVTTPTKRNHLKSTVKKALLISWLTNLVALAIASACAATAQCLQDTAKNCADHAFTGHGFRAVLDLAWWWFTAPDYTIFPLLFLIVFGAAFVVLQARTWLDFVFYSLGHLMLYLLISSTVRPVAWPPDVNGRFEVHMVVWAVLAGVSLWAVTRRIHHQPQDSQGNSATGSTHHNEPA